jgi:hypothetical protein
MTPFDGACWAAAAYLVVRGLSTFVKWGKGPEGWGIRVYPFTMALWAGAAYLVVLFV